MAKDVEQREIEDTARGAAEHIDMENAEHFTGIAAPAERKAILHGRNCASETEDASVFAVDMPGNELNNDWNVQMYVKNSPLKMEIDTGASCNVLSLGTLNSLGAKYDLQQNNVFIKGVHGQSVKSVGCVSLPCTYKGVTNDVQFQVLDGKTCINLLGRYDCVRFGLIARVHRTEAESNKFLNYILRCVWEAIGCIPGE